MLAVGKAAHCAQNHDGGQGRQGLDAGVGQQMGRIGMGERSRGDGLIEVSEMGAKGPKQVETLVTALRGIGRQRKRPELGEASATQELGAADEPLVQGESLHAIFEHGLDADEA